MYHEPGVIQDVDEINVDSQESHNYDSESDFDYDHEVDQKPQEADNEENNFDSEPDPVEPDNENEVHNSESEKNEEVSHVDLIFKRHGVSAENITKINVDVSSYGKLRFENGRLYDTDGRLMKDKLEEFGNKSEVKNLWWVEKNFKEDGIDCGQIFENNDRKWLVINTVNEQGEVDPTFYDLGPVEKKKELELNEDGSSDGEPVTLEAPEPFIEEESETPDHEESSDTSEPTVLDMSAYWNETDTVLAPAEIASPASEPVAQAPIFELFKPSEPKVVQHEPAKEVVESEAKTVIEEVTVTVEGEVVPVSEPEIETTQLEPRQNEPSEPAQKSVDFSPVITFENDRIVFADTETASLTQEHPLNQPEISGAATPQAPLETTENINVSPATQETPVQSVEPRQVAQSAKTHETSEVTPTEHVSKLAETTQETKAEHVSSQANETAERTAAVSERTQQETKQASFEEHAPAAEEQFVPTHTQETVSSPTEPLKRTVEVNQPPVSHTEKVPATQDTTSETELRPRSEAVVDAIEIQTETREAAPHSETTEAAPTPDSPPITQEEVLLRSIGFTNEMVGRFNEFHKKSTASAVVTEVAQNNRRETVLEEDPEAGIKLVTWLN